MTLHLHSCHPVGLIASTSEMRELARRLEQMSNRADSLFGDLPKREAAICADALRRVAGEVS